MSEEKRLLFGSYFPTFIRVILALSASSAKREHYTILTQSNGRLQVFMSSYSLSNLTLVSPLMHVFAEIVGTM